MAGRPTKGCFWQIDTGDSAAFETYGDVKSFTAPEVTVTNVDITSIDQVSNYQQATPGTFQGGDIQLELYWTAAGYADIVALAGATHGFKLVISTVAYSWAGYVDKVGSISGGGPDDPITFKVNVHVNSAVTIGTYTPPS